MDKMAYLIIGTIILSVIIFGVVVTEAAIQENMTYSDAYDMFIQNTDMTFASLLYTVLAAFLLVCVFGMFS